MAEPCVLDAKEFEKELILGLRVQEEHVVPDDLIYKVLPQFWCDLKGIHPEGKQDFDYLLIVIFNFSLDQSLLMFVHNLL